MQHPHFPGNPAGNQDNMKTLNEMTPMEAQSIAGGIFGLLFLEAVVAGIVIASGTNIIDNWDSFKAGLAGRPDPAGGKAAN